ncbi:hypothetical protein BJ741DRAFT_617217 [Chytriomyces cf. hyalinus JEL632]|nr:hypothetical protein BJ741DRAFT_617217 [Chytriomyces cf. hyalinus JEL632]
MSHRGSAELEIVRQRLAQLGYSDAFGAESASLVRRLVADLVQTTEAARKFKAQAEAAQQSINALQEQISPLRATIAQLTAENTAVHADIVSLKDARDAQDRRAEALVRRADNEMQQLRFMAAHCQLKMKAEMAKAEEDRTVAETRFAQLGLLETSNTGRGSKKSNLTAAKVMDKLQKIDLETGLEPLDHQISSFTRPDPEVVDAILLAQGRIESLEKSNIELANQNTDLQNEIQTVRSQVKGRDQEIMRLGAQLEVSRAQQFSNIQVHGRPLGVQRDEGAPSEPADSIHQLPLARQRIEQLEMQIEHLQEHIDTLERERAGVTEEKMEFAQGYQDEIRFLKQEIEAERAKHVEVLKGMTSLEKKVRDLNVAHDRILELEERDHSRNSPAAQTVRAEGRDEQFQHEIGALKMRIAELETILQEKDARIGFLDGKLKELRAHSPTLRPSTQDVRDLESKILDFTKQLQEKDRHKAGLERDAANLRRQLEFAITNNERSAHVEEAYKNLISAKEELERELNLVTSERDDLMSVLEKVETQLIDLHETIEQLSSDRDNMSALYQQAHSEIQTLRSRANVELSSTKQDATSQNEPQMPSPSVAPGPPQTKPNPPQTKLAPPVTSDPSQDAAIIQHLESRERNLQEEVIKLQSDLKAILYRQREAGVHAEEAVRQLENELDSVKTDLGGKISKIVELEETVVILKAEVKSKEQNLLEKDRKVDELRGNLSIVEMNLHDCNMQLKEARSKLQEATLKNESLSTQVSNLSSDLAAATSKTIQHRSLLSQLDSERDSMRAALDSKTESHVEMTQTLETTRASLEKAEKDCMHARSEVGVLEGMRNALDAEVGILQGQVKMVLGERDRYAAELTRVSDNYRNIGTDLAAMTRESQLLNSELSECVRERDRFQAELAECEAQIRYLDSLVRDRDHEKDQAMHAYLKTNTEKDRAELQLQAAAEDISGLRMEVIMRDKRIAQLQRDVEDSAADFGKLKIDLGAYEKKCSSLTKALATAERNCRHLETDKQRLLREIGAVRDLAHTFDKNREQLQKEYASAKLECDRLVKEADRMHIEHENLANEVRSEKSKYERLESILAMERTKKIVVSAPEKDALLSQQQSSLAMAAQNVANLTEQLNSAQQNVEKLEALSRGHIDELEKQQIQIDKLSRDLEESRSRFMRANSRASMSPRSEAHMNRQETPSQAPQSRIGTPKGESEIEKRIQSELESTKDQLRMYEMQIEEHKSRASTPK